MVVVSHTFFLFSDKFREGMTRCESYPLCSGTIYFPTAPLCSGTIYFPTAPLFSNILLRKLRKFK